MSSQAPRGRRLWTGLLAPGALLLAGLFVVPLAMLMVFSVGTTDVVGRPQAGFTFQNFDLVFKSYNLAVAGRTILYAAVATGLCVLIGYAVAYTASRFGGRFGWIIIVLVVVPWLVDYLVRIYAWKQLLGDEGLVNSFIGLLGISPVTWTGTPFAVIGGLTYSYLPLMILPIYASLSDMDSALIDAGKDLFGTPRKTFWFVTLPATREGVFGGCLLVFLPALGDFATAQFLGGARTTMIGNIVSDQFVSSGSQTFGAALTVTLIAMLVLTIAVVAVLTRRHGRLTQIVAP